MCKTGKEYSRTSSLPRALSCVGVLCTLSCSASPRVPDHMGVNGGPELEWPVPPPTREFRLDRSQLFANSTGHLGDVAQALTTRIHRNPRHDSGACGRGRELAWFRLPFEGTAAVSAIEAIDENGKCIPDPFQHPPGLFTGEYVRQLFQGIIAHYRLMLFLIADPEEFRGNRQPAHGPPDGIARIEGILGRPPGDLSLHPYSPNFECYLYIYEFQKTAVESSLDLVPPRTDGRDLHLRAWGIEDLVAGGDAASAKVQQ